MIETVSEVHEKEIFKQEYLSNIQKIGKHLTFSSNIIF